MKWTRICSVLIVLSAVACSSDDKGTGGGGGEKEAATISADEGGKVDVGEGTLTIPGGSLSGDVEVTVETSSPGSVPDKSTVVGLVYDFGPDGTTFDPPATLELPLDRTPSEEQVAVLSWLDEDANAWVDLESTVEDGKVSAPIEHFTKFVVRLKDADAGPVDCSFSACGGDLEGEWVIQSACSDTGSDDENPFGEMCSSATFDVGVDASGNVKFGADGSFELTLTGAPHIAITIPPVCLQNAMFPFPDCTTLGNELGGDDGDVACTGDKSTGCTCSGSGGEPIDEHQTGTYAVSGNSFTTETTDETGAPHQGEGSEFCVSGSTLKVKTSDGTIIQGKRK